MTAAVTFDAVDTPPVPPSGDLPTLTVSSASGAWTFGQAIKRAAAPQFLTGGAGTQVEVRNRWDDGSVKFCVISAQDKSSVTLAASATDTMLESEVALSSSPASVTFTGAVTGTYACPTTNTVGTWSKASAHLVRKIVGPVMTERHYYVPTTDAHVAVWFYVRSYSGGAIEVETVVENGWLNVASPGQKDYTVTVTVGGTTRYSGAVNHYHHTRWSRVDWVGTDPSIVPAHNHAYLRATKLVPNYSGRTPTAPTFTSTNKNPAPGYIGDYSDPMSAAGDAPWIALLPKWDAMYCSSANATAYAATISNTRVLGRYGFHYRDEATGRIPLHSTYPTLTIPNGWGSNWTPTASGTVPPEFELQHSPSAGYTAYLIEGRWTFLETAQYAGFFAIFLSNPATRNGTQGTIPCENSPMTTRGAAWSWRNTAQAAAISPTTGFSAADVAVGPSLEASVRNTATYNKAVYIDGTLLGGVRRNTVGYLGMYDGQAEGTWWWGRCWMTAMQSWVLGYISDLGLNAPDLVAVRNHSYVASTQMQGDNTTWNFRRAGPYDRPYLKNTDKSAPVFPTVQEAYANMKSVWGYGDITANSGDTLKRHGGSDQDITAGQTEYYTWQLPVLALAVEHGQLAAATRNRVLAASNYSVLTANMANDPRWDVVPR